jgi:murein L,D-transpeptidase YafK
MNYKVIPLCFLALGVLLPYGSQAQRASGRLQASAMYHKDGRDYVDAEHAYYNAPLRSAVVYTPFKNKQATKDDYYIVIEKSKYMLDVYNANDELMVAYPVVFGNDDLGDKLYEGDKRTPEGTFYITGKKQHKLWDKYLTLSFPNEESYAKFNERRERGQVPQNASIGGGIGLHGTWANDRVAVDRKENWTSGCVSTKNCYIDELFKYIPVGTRVIIKK